MKKIIVLLVLVFTSILVNGQKEFATKQEAFEWLKNAFSKYFVNNPNGEEEFSNYEYQLSEKYLLITENVRTGKKIRFYACTLIPIDKVAKVFDQTGKGDWTYKKAANLYLYGGGRYFQLTKGKKGFQGEDKYDELTDGAPLPFNVNEEKDIVGTITNAFHSLSQ